MEGHWMTVRSDRLAWHKSTASAGADECVEVARLGRSVLVRDSRDQSGARLTLTLGEWRAFVARIRAGGVRHE
jgi:hypothetical protein